MDAGIYSGLLYQCIEKERGILKEIEGDRFVIDRDGS